MLYVGFYLIILSSKLYSVFPFRAVRLQLWNCPMNREETIKLSGKIYYGTSHWQGRPQFTPFAAKYSCLPCD